MPAPRAVRRPCAAATSTARNLAVALGALGAYGVGTSTGMVTYTSLLQAEVPVQGRGRVFAAFDMTWQTGRLASLVLGGVVADQLGVQTVYILGGVLLLLASSLGLAALPATRHPESSP
jgi:MFS family permease